MRKASLRAGGGTSLARWADPASETAHSAGRAASFLTKASPGCVIHNALFRSKKGRDSLGPTLAGTCLGHSVQIQAVPGQPRMAGQAPACMGYAPGVGSCRGPPPGPRPSAPALRAPGLPAGLRERATLCFRSVQATLRSLMFTSGSRQV